MEPSIYLGHFALCGRTNSFDRGDELGVSQLRMPGVHSIQFHYRMKLRDDQSCNEQTLLSFCNYTNDQICGQQALTIRAKSRFSAAEYQFLLREYHEEHSGV